MVAQPVPVRISMADTNSMSQYLEHHDHEVPEYLFRKAPKPQEPQQPQPKIKKKGVMPLPTGRRFGNKVAIITEAAGGIGFSIAEKLAMEGAVVVITSSNVASLGEATKKLEGKKVLPIACDVSNPQGRKALINQTLEKYEKINVLVSNAVTGPPLRSISETEEKVLDKLWEVSAKTHLLLFKDAKEHLGNQSSVVFVSSAPSDLPQSAIAIHDATKTVLTGLTKALSKELNPEDVRVNSVVTGFEMPTNGKKSFWGKTPKTIFDRIGTRDMASVVVFLASDDAVDVHGETLVTDGRIHSKL